MELFVDLEISVIDWARERVGDSEGKKRENRSGSHDYATGRKGRV